MGTISGPIGVVQRPMFVRTKVGELVNANSIKKIDDEAIITYDGEVYTIDSNEKSELLRRDGEGKYIEVYI